MNSDRAHKSNGTCSGRINSSAVDCRSRRRSKYAQKGSGGLGVVLGLSMRVCIVARLTLRTKSAASVYIQPNHIYFTVVYCRPRMGPSILVYIFSIFAIERHLRDNCFKPDDPVSTRLLRWIVSGKGNTITGRSPLYSTSRVRLWYFMGKTHTGLVTDCPRPPVQWMSPLSIHR